MANTELKKPSKLTFLVTKISMLLQNMLAVIQIWEI